MATTIRVDISNKGISEIYVYVETKKHNISFAAFNQHSQLIDCEANLHGFF